MLNRTGRGAHAFAVLGAMLASLLAGQAQALTTMLDIELDDGLVGSFATVDVVKNGGNLDFAIALDASLGANADLHVFYFNLDAAGLGISTTDTPRTMYELLVDPSVAGGAGSAFDYGAHFGNGGGPPGNGTLQTASFTIFAESGQALSLSDLDALSAAKGGMIDLHFALHVQSTALIRGANSETVGGMMPLPEPSAGFLLSLGLTALAIQGRRPRR